MSYGGNKGGTQKRGTWTGSGEDGERKGIDPSTVYMYEAAKEAI